MIYGGKANNFGIAKALNNLGSLYVSHGKLDEAKIMYARCLAMQHVMHGKNVNNSAIAPSLYNLGCVCAFQGKLFEVSTMLVKSVALIDAIPREFWRNPGLARHLSNLSRKCEYLISLIFMLTGSLLCIGTTQLFCKAT